MNKTEYLSTVQDRVELENNPEITGSVKFMYLYLGLIKNETTVEECRNRLCPNHNSSLQNDIGSRHVGYQ